LEPPEALQLLGYPADWLALVSSEAERLIDHETSVKVAKGELAEAVLTMRKGML